MKLRSARLRGVGPFRDEVVFPVADLGTAEVVAVVGPNGEGKTLSLESIFTGSIHRTTPTHGSIPSIAVTRDSLLEAEWDMGDAVYTARQTINGIARQPKTEAYLLKDGAPVNADGKTPSYKDAVAQVFPDIDLQIASAVAIQGGSGRFLSLGRADKRALFAKLLGLERLQQLADAAGRHAKDTEAELAKLRAQLEALKDQAGQVAQVGEDIEEARRLLRFRRASIAELESQKDAADKMRASWDDRDRTLAEHVTATKHAVEMAEHNHRAATQELRTIEDRLARVTADIAKIQTSQGDRETLLDIIDDGIRARGLLEEVESRKAQEQQRDREHAAAMEAWRDRVRVANEKLVECRRSHEREAENQIKRVDTCRDRVESAEREAGLLGDVPCGGTGEFAACGFLQSAAKARDALPQLRERLSMAEASAAAHASMTRDIEAAERYVAEAEASRPEPLPEDREDLDTRAAEIRKTVSAGEVAAARLEAMDDAAEREAALTQEAEELRAKRESARVEEMAARKMVRQGSVTLSNIETSYQDHAKRKPPEVDPTALREAREREAESRAEVTRLEERLRACEDAVERSGEIRQGIDRETTELDDWTALQRDFGPTGIQALEIDAAGPEVSDVCNELLHATFGSRFTVTLTTTKLKADGKGTKEDFDITVIDTKHGLEGDSGILSGGQKVIINEALSLAIAIYNCQRSSIPMLDLVRDECSGALYPDTAPRYVTMLRRALAIGGFHRVYFVTHDPQLWALADSVVEVRDGDIRIAEAADIVVKPQATEEAA